MIAAVPPTSDPRPQLVATTAGPIAVTDEGPADAPAVLCLHGIPGSARDFRYLAPRLVPHWRVLRLEMPGFGTSPASGITGLDGWAAVPAAVADALGLRRPTLLAHSFGGGAALLAAADSRRFDGLALLASMGPRRHRSYAHPPWAWAALTALVRLPAIGHLLASAAARGYRSRGLPPPSGRRELLLHLRLIASVDFAVLADAAASVQVPAVVAFCEDDRLVEPSIHRELAALLPRAEMVVFPDGGHHLQKHRAAEVAEAVHRVLGPG